MQFIKAFDIFGALEGDINQQQLGILLLSALCAAQRPWHREPCGAAAGGASGPFWKVTPELCKTEQIGSACKHTAGS